MSFLSMYTNEVKVENNNNQDKQHKTTHKHYKNVKHDLLHYVETANDWIMQEVIYPKIMLLTVGITLEVL